MVFIIKVDTQNFTLTLAEAKLCDHIKFMMDDLGETLSDIVIDLSDSNLAGTGCDNPDDERNLHFSPVQNQIPMMTIPKETLKLLHQGRPVYIDARIKQKMENGEPVLSRAEWELVKNCEPMFVDPEEQVYIPTAAAMQQVVKFLQFYGAGNHTDDYMEKWSRVFVRSQTPDMLSQIMLIANFLECMPLLMWTSKRAAAMIKGRTFEEIVSLYNLDETKFSDIAKYDMLMNNEWCDDTENWWPEIATVDELSRPE